MGRLVQDNVELVQVVDTAWVEDQQVQDMASMEGQLVLDTAVTLKLSLALFIQDCK